MDEKLKKSLNLYDLNVRGTIMFYTLGQVPTREDYRLPFLTKENKEDEDKGVYFEGYYDNGVYYEGV